MVGYEMIKTIGNVTATYKFTPKYVLKAGQKVTVRVCLSATAVAEGIMFSGFLSLRPIIVNILRNTWRDCLQIWHKLN